MRKRKNRFRPSLWIVLFLFLVSAGTILLFSGKEIPMQRKEVPQTEVTEDENSILTSAKDDLDNTINVWTDLFNVLIRGEESKYENGYEALAGRGVEKKTAEAEAEPQNPLELTAASLVRIVDGDTIVVSMDDETYKVRLIGIDTPESVHADEDKNTIWGTYASDHTKELLDGIETVYLEFDQDQTDQYGRTLAYVWLTSDRSDMSQMLNYRIVADGYAKAKVYMPNDRYADVFADVENTAVENQTGLWGEEDFKQLWTE